MNINFRITKDQAEIISFFPLIEELNSQIEFEKYKTCVEDALNDGNYEMLVVFDEKNPQEIIGIAGFSITSRFYLGRFIQISNMVVKNQYRNLGIGKKILNFIEEEGKKRNCKFCVLDSYTDNKKSHALYFRQGFYIRGFHFIKELN